MATVQDLETLRRMIMALSEYHLQLLLEIAGLSKLGRKHELQNRALQLIQAPQLHNHIRQLYQYQTVQASQASSGAAGMMSPNGHHYNYNIGVSNMTYAQALQSGRNIYQGQTAQPSSHHQLYANAAYQNRSALPANPDVKIVKLPFFDVLAELLKPTSLIPHGNGRFQDAKFQFFLSPSQATDIASHRNIQAGLHIDYLYQIQLRFCPLHLEPNKELKDEFPPNVNLSVNGKMVTLPNPIPSTKPGVDPKRPPRPVNITSYCKLSPILPNSVDVKWATEYGKAWICGIWLVMKCTSKDLLDRLKRRGARDPDHTRKLIIDKLNDNDSEVATTSLKVSVLCPLGKMRMKIPCRPLTCDHLQCFDASTFLLMNEKKSTWNCPVCDSKAMYDSLRIDGYFQDIIDSKDLPNDQHEIILERDGSWKPVIREDADAEKTQSKKSDDNDDVDCIDLSDDDDDEIPLPPSQPSNGLPPLPPPLPTGPVAPPPPPPPPAEIECIDLD